MSWYNCFQDVRVYQDDENNWRLTYSESGEIFDISLDEIHERRTQNMPKVITVNDLSEIPMGNFLAKGNTTPEQAREWASHYQGVTIVYYYAKNQTAYIIAGSAK